MHRMPGLNFAITALRKRRRSGELYSRDPEIEALLVKLSSLSQDELIARAAISRREDPCYIPSECLVYFIRASRDDDAETWFERLYKILTERVLRSLPKADGKTETRTRDIIREEVFARFVEILSADRRSYLEKLDYFEVRFDSALANLRRDAQRQAWRDEKRRKRTVPLEYDDETGEPSAEVERAAGHFDPFAASKIDDAAYRLRLDAAIDSLPSRQRRIIEMLRKGFLIDSKDPDVVTISKALRCSEKTVRTQRDKAFATLRVLLEGEKR